MEPSEFDQLIRDKISGDHNRHSERIARSKPILWDELQKGKEKKAFVFNWYAAAAVILLLICFSFAFLSMQNQHSKELQALSQKIDLLQQDYGSQTKALQYKDLELSTLCNELDQLESSLYKVKNQLPSPIQTIFVSKVDTVYIREIEYIATQIPSSLKTDSTTTTPLASKNVNENSSPAVKTSKNIYPSFAKQSNKQAENSSAIKFKLAVFNPN